MMQADLVAFGTAMFGAFFLLMSKQNVNSLPFCTLMVIMNVHMFLIQSFLACQLHGMTFFSLDKYSGCFGFLNPDGMVYNVLVYGILAGVIGSAGYSLSLMFFSPLVVSNCFLIEPVVAQFNGYMLSIDQMPGLMTVLGGIVTLAGVYLIGSASKQKEKKMKQDMIHSLTAQYYDGSMLHNSVLTDTLKKDEVYRKWVDHQSDTGRRDLSFAYSKRSQSSTYSRYSSKLS